MTYDHNTGQHFDLNSTRDQRLYAWITIVTAIAVAAYLYVSTAHRETPWATEIAFVAFLASVAGLTFWQRRSLRTIPRGANRVTMIGAAAMLALWIPTVTAINYFERDGESLWWGWHATGALFAVTPALVAAAVLYRRAA